MNANMKLLLSAALIVLLASGSAMAGRGGGGFHGSVSGGGVSRGGADVGSRGADFGNRSGADFANRGQGNTNWGAADRGQGNMNWGAANRTPSFESPRPAYNPERPDFNRANWSNVDSHFGMNARPSVIANPNLARNVATTGLRPGEHPWVNHNPDWYHGNWNNHWDHHWNNWPAGWWGAGFATGALWGAATTPWSWGYCSYYNPYCPAPVVLDNTTIDYSQPIVMAGQPTADSSVQPSQSQDQSLAADQAMQLLDTARKAFAQADYAGAMSLCDSAIAKLPNDVVLHEFRGLVLFATNRYKEAAGTIYAVLSVGPGWDWTTLSGFYPNIDVYTEQLRALEHYVDANPNTAEARFLLAYQYMTCGQTQAAADQLKAAVQLNPKDRLSAQLFSALSTTTQPEQPTPTTPTKPVEASALVGNWKASRPDGATIALNLAKDGNYTWQFAQKGKPQTFNGAYSVADNLLILKQGGNPVMVGQVSSLADNRFNFKLPGDNPNDPGLTFAK